MKVSSVLDVSVCDRVAVATKKRQHGAKALQHEVQQQNAIG